MARYVNQTFEVILDRMLARVPDEMDKREGSIIYDMLSPVAVELAHSYIELENVLDFGYVETSFGEYIDYRVNEMGMTRKPATKAMGYVLVKGEVGAAIPVGTQFVTNSVNPVYFLSLDPATIGTDGKVSIRVEAEEVGVSGNVAVNKIRDTKSNIPGISTVTNEYEFSGGTDIETDDELVSRYLEKVRTPQTTGNVNDYVKWAKEVPGIGEARCIPLWNGPGTVKVVTVDSNRQTPTMEKLVEVANHIESFRPIGASVNVTGAVEVPVNITAKIILDNGATLDEAKAEITKLLTDYLASVAFKDTLVRYNFISSFLVQAITILDFEGLTVNGAVKNISIGQEQIPVLGTVTFSV